MCETCYERGYDDFPKWVGSVPHVNDYNLGFQARQREEGYDAECVDERDFCQKCFDRGYEDAQSEYWAPPSTRVRGHRESYEIGYNKDKNDAYIREQEDLQNRLEEERAILESQRMYERAPKAKGFLGWVDDILNAFGINRYNDYLKYILTKFLVVGISIGVALALALWIALIIISAAILNLGVLGLLFAFILAEGNRKNRIYLGVSIIGIIYILLDYNNGWISENINSFPTLKGMIFYLNVVAGLVSVYFTITQYYFSSSSILPLEKKNLAVIGTLCLLGLSIIGFQKYHDDKTVFGYNISQASLFSGLNSESEVLLTPDTSVIAIKKENSSGEDVIENKPEPAKAVNQIAEQSGKDRVTLPQKAEVSTNVVNIKKANSNHEKIIHQLFSYDDARDESKISSIYSDKVKDFWHLNKPSKEQILSSYKSRWKRQVTSKNIIEHMTKIDDDTYKIQVKYQYVKVKDKSTYNVTSDIVVKFDENNKIVSVNGTQH
jgi:type III secretory pathway component EscS